MTNREYAEIIVKEVEEKDLYNGSVYSYIAGRFPRLSIKRVFEIVMIAIDII